MNNGIVARKYALYIFLNCLYAPEVNSYLADNNHPKMSYTKCIVNVRL